MNESASRSSEPARIADRLASEQHGDTINTLKEIEALSSDNPSHAQVVSLRLLSLAERASQRLHAETDHLPDAARRACAARCSACCHIAVSVTPAEAIRVAEQLRQSLSPGEFLEVSIRVAVRSQQVSGMTLEERAAARIPCVFLDKNGACSIHDFRPLGCRGWTSFSRKACEDALVAGENGHSGPMDAATFAAAAALAEGLQSAAREFRVDCGSYELHSAIHRAMDAPDAASHWARGDKLFSACARVRSDRWRG